MGYISAHKTGDRVVVWERKNNKAREIKIYPAPYYFYVEDPDGTHKSIYGDTVSRFDFDTGRELHEEKKKVKFSTLKTFESDISPELKVLSERYYNKPAPTLNVSFYDIEIDYDPNRGFGGVSDPYAPINSVAIYHEFSNEFVVIAVPPPEFEYTPGSAPDEFMDSMSEIAEFPGDLNLKITFVKDERELITLFMDEIENSDVMSGWNCDGFDRPYIGKRAQLLGGGLFRRLNFPEAGNPKWRTYEKYGTEHETLDLTGRVGLDYLMLFQKYEMSERPSYKLEAIADEVVPELPKLEYSGSLAKLYKEDFAWFIRYNIRDTEILKGFEEKLGYVELANQMVHLSTGQFNHVGGTLKLAELATINYCHFELDGLIVNDINRTEIDANIKGAYVLSPKVGLHDMIGSIDINSLYPSAIRSLNISPEKIVGQFHDDIKASHHIAANTNDPLIFEYENGITEERSAKEWREVLLAQTWAVSGFGTVFDQTKKGIIPAILENWYGQRKNYQRLMIQAKEEAAKVSGDEKTNLLQKAAYYDRLQYVFKIKLNSFYGALTNKYFRFFDLRMGESTTACGRAILRHQCAETNRLMTGEYDVSGEAVIYGDTDSCEGSTIINTSEEGDISIEDLFNSGTITNQQNNKEFSKIKDTNKVLTWDNEKQTSVYGNVQCIYRHKVSKERWSVEDEFGNVVIITGDHSVMIERDGVLMEAKASELTYDDILITARE